FLALQHSHARWIPLAWQFAKKLRSENADRFDIVHFTDAREALWFTAGHPVIVGNINDFYAAQLQPLSYYRQHYTDAWVRWLYYFFVRQCERFTLPKLRAIIANSEYTRSAVQSAYLLPPHKLFKCFKCINLDVYKTTIKRSYRSTDGLVLFVGGNMQRKGLQDLIKAAPLVVEKHPSVKFLIAGHDNNIPKMLQMCRQLGVESHFKFLGWVPNEEVQKLYWEASVFVMPSLSEAFGVAILEAMASGTPVVATRVGGIPELVEHNVNGLLVEPNNYKALAEAILTVLENTDIAARLGQQGRITAQRFGLEQMIKCTYRVYEAILSDS
ncbi:MAG: glycosyltransferase family 4 protein, partial [Nitrososphaerota archaeon]